MASCDVRAAGDSLEELVHRAVARNRLRDTKTVGAVVLVGGVVIGRLGMLGTAGGRALGVSVGNRLHAQVLEPPWRLKAISLVQASMVASVG